MAIFLFLNAVKDYWYYKFREVNPGPDHHNLTVFEVDPNAAETLSYYDGINSTDTESNWNSDRLTPLQLKWNSYLSISNMIPNVCMVMLNASFGHKFPMRSRILGSLTGIALLFIFTDVMTKVNTDNFQYGFLSLTLTTVVLITSCVGLLQVNKAIR